MKRDFTADLNQRSKELRETGFYKHERAIRSPQRPLLELDDGRTVVNFCANNYLGLSDHPDLIASAHRMLDHYGYGMASVRFICGTQTIHQQLEASLSAFLGTEDTILYSSCFDANGGLFETLFEESDAIISDQLNHASIIDGIRLSKAARYRYANNDMADLEQQLQAASGARYRLIVTDGVFSMDGIMANLPGICALADKYDALVMVDDSHAVGFIGPQGGGTPDFYGLRDRIDIVTGTLGKALGGASGGYTSGKKPVIDWLRQRSRPYLFSNSLAPVIAGVSITALELLQSSQALRQQLIDNATYFRAGLTGLGFDLVPGQHPIIPVLLGDAALASRMAEALLKEAIYVVGFSFPVVPKGQARIRTQMCAAHTREQLDFALEGFAKVGRDLGVIR
jgi:glycine C-acetyltransferase